MGGVKAMSSWLQERIQGGYLLPAALGLTVLYVVVQCIYHLYISPLRKFPGPKIAAVSRLPQSFHALRGDMVTWIQGLHDTYGDVVRIGPDELSYTSSEAWKTIYGHAVGGMKTMEKDQRFLGPPFFSAPDIIRAPGADHSRFRRNFSHAFSERALREQEPLIRHYVDMLVAKLGQDAREKPDGAVELVHLYNYTTFDIMGDLTFGEPLDLLKETGKNTAWVATVFTGIKASALRRVTRYYPVLGSIFNAFIPASMTAGQKAHIANCVQRVDTRVEKQTDRPDIWGLIMNQKEELRLSREEMYANSSISMVAGTETTATALSGLTYQLLLHPEKMERITREVRETFEKDSDINITTLGQMKYLNACIEEGLRFYPPVPIGLPRVVPPGGQMVCGEYVPEKTIVSVNQWSAYRSPRNFNRPNEFLPERWMNDPEFASDDKAALQPFSFGPRNCLGRNLAYFEMRIILAKVLYNFDLTLRPESVGWDKQKTFLLWEKKKLMVQLKRRD
ncbi:cytochrome P450 [Aspergillus egyptiacus]|nr:cytochrome P450 [Aspergillus egyptiacus]